MGTFTILINLSVLVIVGIALTLFRKADKNNKSLEQVKKYATKRNEEFDLYVEEKISYLKDISVSLEVQEKTGIVILNRISGEVDSLSEKIEYIEELNKKVTGYNSTMDKMLNLSQELNDRYVTLKKDSTYLEQVDKKIKESKKKLFTVEKSIDEIADEFIKNNNISINKVKDNVLNSTKHLAEELEGKINKSSMDIEHVDILISELNKSYQSNAKDTYDTFKDDLHLLLETHRINVEKITSEGESLEEASFSEIKNKISIRSSNLLEILEDKLNNIEVENSEKISKLSMDMGNVELIANNIKEENKVRLDSIKSQIDNQLLMLKDVNSKGVSDLQEEFTVNLQEFKEVSLSQIEKTKTESDFLITELKDQLNEAKDYRDDVVEKLASAESYVGSEFSDLKDRVESSVHDITHELESHEEKIRTAAFNQLESSLELYKSEVEEKIGDLSSVKIDIENVKQELTTDLADVKGLFDSELYDIKTDVKEHKDSVEIDIENLKSKITTDLEDSQKLVDNSKIEITSSINDIKNNQDRLKEELLNNEKEIRAQVGLQRDRLLTNVDNDINNKIDVIKEEFVSKLNSFVNFEDEINQAKVELEEFMSSKNGSLEKEVLNFKEDMSLKMNQETATLNDFIKTFEQEKIGLEGDIFRFRESTYNNVSEKLDIFRDEFDDKIKSFVNFEDNINSAKSELENLMLSKNERINAEVINFQEKLSSRMDKEQSTFNDFFIKFNEEKLELQSDVNNLQESTYQNVVEKLKVFSDEFNNKIDSFSTFENEINSVRNDLEDLMYSKNGVIEEDISKFHTALSLRMDEEKSSLNEFLKSFSQEKLIIENDMQALKKSTYDNVSEKLNIFEDEYFSELKDKKDKIEVETNLWRNKIDNSAQEIIEYNSNSIVENMDDFNKQVLNFKDTILENFSNLKVDVESKVELLVSNMQSKEIFVLNEAEVFKESALNEIAILKDQLSLLNKDVNNKSIALNDTLTKISDEQSKYITETEIFTRTDKLKNDLEVSIETLTSRLSENDEKSDFVRITNDKLNNLVSIIEDINIQIENVDKKRVKVESLENRVSKVLELSDSVDDKLSRIKESEDEIGDIQLKLRELKVLEESVSLEFDRLENKESILEETNKAIDSGFSNIQIIENRIDLLKENLNPFNNQIDNIKDKLNRVESKEQNINRAIDALSTLNGSIDDIEVKIEKMDKAREWIAGVETRLDDSVRTANEQVKLMGALAQNKNDVGTKDTGKSAPNLNMRDMVIKLAHNGWKAEDIARTTKLSRGEVELILELSPKK